LTWDFRRYLGVPLSEVGGPVSHGEAIALIAEMGRETGSHLYADLAGFTVAATQADLASIIHAEWYINVHRDQKKSKPVELPKPFTREVAEEPVSDERRDELRAQLRARSAFRE
jgi:hypothetical protein